MASSRGHTVVADCVNPLPVTRDAWRAVVHAADVPLVEVELAASDVAEHRRRVEIGCGWVRGGRPPTGCMAGEPRPA